MKKAALLEKVRSFAPTLHQTYRITTSVTYDKKTENGYALYREGSLTLDLRKVALYSAGLGALLWCLLPKRR